MSWQLQESQCAVSLVLNLWSSQLVSWLLLILLCYQYHVGQFSPAPMSITTFLNHQVQFICGTFEYVIKWEVNGVEARHLQSRNVTFHTEFNSMSHYENSTLLITANLAHNNSEITCSLSTFGGGEVARISAFLYIQGNLIPWKWWKKK